jgi:hypothetical protein
MRVPRAAAFTLHVARHGSLVTAGVGHGPDGIDGASMPPERHECPIDVVSGRPGGADPGLRESRPGLPGPVR